MSDPQFVPCQDAAEPTSGEPHMTHVIERCSPDVALCGYRFRPDAPAPYDGPSTADECAVCFIIDGQRSL